MATIKENQNILNETSNEINEDEFLDAQLPAPLSNLETSCNKSINISNNNSRNSNNNRHVVPFGIFIVFCTLYLTVSAFQRTNQTITPTFKSEPEDVTTISQLRQKEDVEKATYLDKLLKHKDICNELEIFVNKFQWTDKYDEYSNACEKDTNMAAETEIETEATTDSNAHSYKQKKKQSTTQMRKHIRNGKKLKNGQNGKRYNKSTTKTRKINNKHSNIENKKEQNKKKSSTAEPIIYLFALVLIYLLFKAASDINQHYKTQAKGDKRLRRCSLQSYAQAHKQDRRASKDHTSSVLSRKHLEQRTQSLDRYYMQPHLENTIEQVDMLSKLQKQISIDETLENSLQNQKFNTPPYSKIFNDKTLQAQSVGNIFNAPTELDVSNNRRCSVPALTIASKTRTANNPTVSSARRISAVGQLSQLGSSFETTNRRTSLAHGSIIGQLGNSFDATDPFQFTESKRRVRMINRH